MDARAVAVAVRTAIRTAAKTAGEPLRGLTVSVRTRYASPVEGQRGGKHPHLGNGRAAGPAVPSWRSTWPSLDSAVGLARQVVAGWLGRSYRLPLRAAWLQLMNNPGQNRYSRRVARLSPEARAAERAMYAGGRRIEIAAAFEDGRDPSRTTEPLRGE
ncbi:MAG: hypothetical protein L0I76_33905 [Pseudonocardia sp.]|nr:hypothetical protein [Pseudonocardia sp.]MDN5931183.1 hypothetical protein [Pseudonocardia sp.]